RPAPSYRAWPRPPIVVAGDSYAARGPVIGPGSGPEPGYPVGGPFYQNAGANGGAYVAPQPIAGPRIIVGGYDAIRGPIVGPSGYVHPTSYSSVLGRGISGPRELSYNGPIPIEGVGPSRINYLGRERPDGYTRPAAIDEGPMTTVKILLPDGSTKFISIPARFMSNTVDEYAGGPGKYAGPVALPGDAYGAAVEKYAAARQPVAAAAAESAAEI
ncbi:hypothetical protein PFISCL1PPCAC_3838, partial [Pristionchus fissidentatus]